MRLSDNGQRVESGVGGRQVGCGHQTPLCQLIIGCFRYDNHAGVAGGDDNHGRAASGRDDGEDVDNHDDEIDDDDYDDNCEDDKFDDDQKRSMGRCLHIMCQRIIDCSSFISQNPELY